MADGMPSIRDAVVGNVMTEAVETIPADRTASGAASRLADAGIGSLLVGGDAGPPGGILTESDLVEPAATERNPGTVTVEECISAPVTTVSTSTTLGDAADLLSDEGMKKLPVLDDDRVVGIVTTTHIAKYLPVHEFRPAE